MPKPKVVDGNLVVGRVFGSISWTDFRSVCLCVSVCVCPMSVYLRM